MTSKNGTSNLVSSIWFQCHMRANKDPKTKPDVDSPREQFKSFDTGLDCHYRIRGGPGVRRSGREYGIGPYAAIKPKVQWETFDQFYL